MLSIQYAKEGNKRLWSPRMCKLYHGHNLRGYTSHVILNLLCSCGSSIESTSHYLLHSPIFNDKRYNLLRLY